MTESEYLEFAKKYSAEQFDVIEFTWNGKHGENFIDKNYEFRIDLCQTIKDDLSIAPDELIIDLYIELSKSAKETFSVYNSFHIFANELLKRGGVKYLDYYMEGAEKSMDTLLSSARLNLDKSAIQEILDHLKKEVKKSNPPRGYEHMIKRFEWLEQNK